MRRPDLRQALLAVMPLLCVMAASPALAQRGSERERQRQKLQEQLGLQPPAKSGDRPDAGLPAPSTETGTAEEADVAPGSGAAAAPAKPGSSPAPARKRQVTYVDDAWPVLERRCGSCHAPGGKGGRSRWSVSGDARVDFEATLRMLDPAAAAKSRLLLKATGETRHGAGRIIASDSAEYATLLRWIESGAPFGRAPDARAVASPAVPSASGVAKPKVASPPPASSEPRQVQGPSTEAPSETTGVASPPAAVHEGPGAGSTVILDPRVHALLQEGCASCHAPGEMAGDTAYVVSTDPVRHLATLLTLVTPGAARTSLLLQRAKGVDHGGGAIWEEGSPELATLAAWIDGLAPQTAGSGTDAQVADGAPQGPPATAESSTGATAAASPHRAGPGRGLQLGTLPFLGTLQLNGRFDLNYERRGYNDHPFQSEGQDALRSYHQFLFLTRTSQTDPVTLTVELLSLQFWELGARLSPEAWPVQVSARLGKILVPFGSDPLYHHSYGGLAGFDQEVLPIVWAREGLRFNVEGRFKQLALTGDAYVVAGHRLRQAEGVLNLQSDFAPLDEVRLAVGARVGAAWGPISLWYSPYFNTLGFGRRLFLQAVDLEVWRPRGVPVLQQFSLAAGLLRADVSGGAAEGYGGPGADYYHFASYLQLRYYPVDWLYLQYRQGLRTMTNRRGVYLDETDLTIDDGSAHNVGIVARWRGLSGGIYHFWNLEKVDEVPDDFLRVVVTYEF